MGTIIQLLPAIQIFKIYIYIYITNDKSQKNSLQASIITKVTSIRTRNFMKMQKFPDFEQVSINTV